MTMPEGLVSASGPGSPWSIGPQGDRTVLLTHQSDGIANVAIGRKCAQAAALLRAASLRGINDIVPAFNTVALHFKPGVLGDSSRFNKLTAQVQQVLEILQRQPDNKPGDARTVDIPVCYGGHHGPDLAEVAQHCGLSSADVIELHSTNTAYVFMLGFAPGAPYIGVHDERLNIGRRATPRVKLPAGSVAMANRQTIIYPNASPGGWHIIGATPVTLFNPGVEPPALLNVGDTIRFVPISADEFHALQAQPA